MPLEFKPAFRKSTPLLLSIASVTGGGKTYSALLLARGLAGPSGTVAFIDAENGRGEMYSDSPGIIAAYRDHPNGIYDYARIDPPFTPERYMEYVKAAESSGASVGIIDSTSHVWDGTGGCIDMAEKARGMWTKPKLEHKKFVNCLLSSKMHWILCLRAQEKVKVFGKGDPVILSYANIDDAAHAPIADKTLIVPIGLQPIAEKHLTFDMTVSLMLDANSHFAVPIKVPEPLQKLFPGGRMLTREDGERIRQWNNTGSAVAEGEQLRKRARAAAEDGMDAYKAFFGGVTTAQRKLLADVHEEMKAVAAKVDADASQGAATAAEGIQ